MLYGQNHTEKMKVKVQKQVMPGEVSHLQEK